MRPFQLKDYSVWKAAYTNTFPKQNEFDLEKKSPNESSLKVFKNFVKLNSRYIKQEQIFQFGIFEKQTGRLMGYLLLALIVRFNVQSARISYVILNNYWKHGYGREAVEGLVRFAFHKLKLHRLEVEIEPHNRASIALIKAVGFQPEGIRRGAVYFDRKWHDHVVYAILAEDRGIKNFRPSIFRK